MISKYSLPVLMIGLSLLLSGCTPGEMREKLGMVNESPDEFSVIKRAPLEVSNAILDAPSLPTPQEGAARPQESSPEEAARAALIGHAPPLQATTQQQQRLSAGDKLFLQRTGAPQAQPNIRSQINTETQELDQRNKPVAERLFNWGGSKDIPSATIVDSEAEAKRIRKNLEAGQPSPMGKPPRSRNKSTTKAKDHVQKA